MVDLKNMMAHKKQFNPKWRKRLSKSLKKRWDRGDLAKLKRQHANRKGKLNGRWKGGKSKTVYGYISIWAPNHPKAYQGRILEHRLVMEKKLGRYLKSSEIVHHINGIKDDNRPRNLELVIRGTNIGKRKRITCPFCDKSFSTPI